jgi:hypothetical protein
LPPPTGINRGSCGCEANDPVSTLPLAFALPKM